VTYTDFRPMPPPQPARKRWSIALVAAGIVPGIVIGAGAVLGYQAYNERRGGADDSITVTGELTLTDPSGWSYGAGGCLGDGGYSDIAGGANVTIKGATGAVIGVTHLKAGKASGGDCAFAWTASGIPGNEQFYTVEISHRGALTYPRNQLGSVLQSSLGD